MKNGALLALICWSATACAGTPNSSSKSSTDTAANADTTKSGDLLETFRQGCKAELESYCKDVTSGEGRILACIYALGDKISGRCEYAMYDSAAQL